MSDLISLILPADLIPIIKEYTGEIRIRNGRPMKQFKSNDRRYSMLRRIPKIRQLNTATNLEYEKRGAVWFKTSDKSRHIVISVYWDNIYKWQVWEMRILGGSVVSRFL
jgi:hypothetical protein